MRKYLWILLLAVLGLGLWLYMQSHAETDGTKDDKHADAAKGDGKNAGGAKNAPVLVGAATAKITDLPVYLTGLGNITPRSTVVVHSQINGELTQVLFKEGQLVKKGDMLARIDDKPYIAALEQAQGLLMRDKALLKEAQIDLERYRTLWKQDSIARQQLDTQASLAKQYEGAVKNDEGTVDAARANLDYTKIASPVNGRVGLRQVDAGNIVHTTDTNGIVIVTELQPITAFFTLPEDNMPAIFKQVDAQEKLETQAWDRSNAAQLATGSLAAIDNQVDTATGTVKFRAEFANEDGSLFPSQFVNIRLKLETLRQVVTISTASVQRGTHGTFVYLIKPDKTVSVQPVTLGPADGESVMASKGVKEGDQLVVDGADTLRDGSRVALASLDGKPVAGKKDGDPDKGGDAPKPADGGEHPHKHHKHADADKS